MEDDTNTQVIQQPTAADIAREVVAMQAVHMPQAAPPQQQQFNAIAAAAQRLKDEGYPDEYIRGNLLSVQAAQISANQNINAAMNQLRSEMQGSKQMDDAHSIINAVLGSYSKEDPLVRKAEVAIRADIEAKFFKDPSLIAKWNRGLVDKAGIEKITEEAVDEFLKVAGRSTERKNAAPPMKVTGGNVVNIQSGKKVEDEEELNENQREYFNAAVTARMQYLGEDRKTATKTSLERAGEIANVVLKKAVR